MTDSGVVPGADAGTSWEDAAPGVDAGAADEHAALRFVTPRDTAYARDEVTLQLLADGPISEVELRVDGEPLARIGAPFQYVWDVAHELEGEHLVEAIARSGARDVSAEPVHVVVDRTAPSLVSHTSTRSHDVGAPIVLRFDEPVRPETLVGSAVQLHGSASGLIATRIEALEDGLGAKVWIEGDVAPPEQITVSIAASIADRAGNVMPPTSWRFDVEAWVSIDPPADATGGRFPERAVRNGLVVRTTREGAILVAIVAPSADGAVARVIRYDGAWAQLGEAIVAPRGSNSAVIDLDASGSAPVLAIMDAREAPHAASIVRWDGEAWGEVASFTSSMRALDVAVASDDTIYTVVDRGVRLWDGEQWARVGATDLGGELSAIALGLTASDEPVVLVQARTNMRTGEAASRTYRLSDAGEWAMAASGTTEFFRTPVPAIGAAIEPSERWLLAVSHGCTVYGYVPYTSDSGRWSALAPAVSGTPCAVDHLGDDRVLAVSAERDAWAVTAGATTDDGATEIVARWAPIAADSIDGAAVAITETTGRPLVIWLDARGVLHASLANSR